MTTMPIRDVSLSVDVVGHGYPLLLMHGGPGADHWSLLPLRRCADRFTLVFYDHRCNGRSTGAPVSSMTWQNQRFFTGQITPNEFMPALIRFGGAYYHRPSIWRLAREMIRGEWRTKTRPEAPIFAGRHLLNDWTVMYRLAEITVPTLVIAGRDDFLFPPEHQAALAGGIHNARLRIIERAGHNAHAEQPTEVIQALTAFIPAGPAAAAPPAGG